MNITTLGTDLAKSVFQLHDVDAGGIVVLRKRLRRGAVLNFLGKLRPCLIGMGTCATSQYWAREIAALGHEVRLIPPAYVKPYVKRQKNDAVNAEAICEAVTRPNKRFVPVKTEAQQSVLVLHRSRDLLMSQRTMTLNAIRAHFAEFGVIAAQGPRWVVELVKRLSNLDELGLPTIAQSALLFLGVQLENPAEQIGKIERLLLAWHRQNEASQRLETIPVLALSPPQPLLPACLTQRSSNPVDSSPTGWGSCPGRFPREARTGSDGYRRWGMATCADCWWSVPPPSHDARRPIQPELGSGCDPSSNANRHGL